jgi:hypothetical protein
MTPGPRTAAAIALGVVGCIAPDTVDRDEQRSDVPNTGVSAKAYPLADSSLTPLAPVNSVTKSILAVACVTKPDGTPLDSNDFHIQGANSSSFLELAKSRTQVDDALSVKVAASFSTPFAGASAEVEASREASVRGESIYLVGELLAYTNHVVSAGCTLTLTENATEMLTDDSGFTEVPEADRARYRAAAFLRICGDGYTQARQMGAGGTLILEFQAQSSSAKNSIRAELTAHYGTPLVGAKIGAAVAASKSRLGSQVKLKVTLVTRGAIGGIPDATDLEADPNGLANVVAKLDEVKRQLAAATSVDNLAPMSARLAAYNGLAPWKGWSHYDPATKAKIRAAADLIKPLAEEMEKFLGLRASLVKELDAIQAQIKTIREVYAVRFNYDGRSQRNYAGTAVLPPFGTTADYSDLDHYKLRFEQLKTQLQAEMTACVDSGNTGYIRCKPSATLPTAVARDIVKWRTNRPQRFVMEQAPRANSAAAAATQCATYDGGNRRVVTHAEARFLRYYTAVHLAAAEDGHRSLWVGDRMNGEKCDGGGLAHSKYYDATTDELFWVCGQPWDLGVMCMPNGAASIWDTGYWRDEVDLAALGL